MISLTLIWIYLAGDGSFLAPDSALDAEALEIDMEPKDVGFFFGADGRDLIFPRLARNPRSSTAWETCAKSETEVSGDSATVSE